MEEEAAQPFLQQARHRQLRWQVTVDQPLSGMSWGTHSFPADGSRFCPALLADVVLVAPHQGGSVGSQESRVCLSPWERGQEDRAEDKPR